MDAPAPNPTPPQQTTQVVPPEVSKQSMPLFLKIMIGCGAAFLIIPILMIIVLFAINPIGRLEEAREKAEQAAKVATFSATQKDETANWNTYQTTAGGFSLKYPNELSKSSESDLKNYPNVGQFEVYFSSERFSVIIDKWLGAEEKTNALNDYQRIESLTVGSVEKNDIVTSTRKPDAKIDSIVGVSEMVDRGVPASSDGQESRYSKEIYIKKGSDIYTITLWSNNDSFFSEGSETLDQILTTFKFL